MLYIESWIPESFVFYMDNFGGVSCICPIPIHRNSLVFYGSLALSLRWQGIQI